MFKLANTIGLGVILGIIVAIWGVNRNDPVENYIIPQPSAYFADVIINAPYCIRGQDNSLMIQGLLDEIERIQQVTTPSTEAAAFDLYGATVALKFNHDICEIHNTIILKSANMNFQNGYFQMPLSINKFIIQIDGSFEGMRIENNMFENGNGLNIK